MAGIVLAASLGMAVFTTVPAGLASAQSVTADCDAEGQARTAACAEADLAAAEAELAEVWEQAREQATIADEFEPADSRGAAQAIETAHRAWREYRDAHCTAEGFQARGSPMEPAIVAACKARLTQRRIEQLRTLVQELGTQ